ncbi:MAG TPA: diacylglycerol kinase family protein [Planctomycetota bacterium]|nr:diacylglycerol kinase family protein [Planctomycetota bacterium]
MPDGPVDDARRSAAAPEIALLCNPAAGGGRTAARVRAAFARVFGGGAPVLATPDPRGGAPAPDGALRALPDNAVLVVAGGDGTLHAALNLLEAARGDRPWPRLAHLPAGSANDGARALAQLTGRGHDGDFEVALRAIAARVACNDPGRPADVGFVRGAGTRRLFANFAAAGSPADWAALSARPLVAGLKRVSVRLAYGACNLWVIAQRRIHRLEVGLDQEPPAARPVFAWFAAKARFLGGGLDLGPAVRLDSGALHVVTIDPAPRRTLLRLLHESKRGLPPASVAVRAAHLHLPAPGRLNLDGENVDFGGVASVEVGILPGRARWL